MIKLTTDLLVGYAGIDGYVTGAVPMATVSVPVECSLHLNIDNRGWLGVTLLDSGMDFEYDNPVWGQFTGNLTMMGLSRNLMFKLVRGQVVQVTVLNGTRRERLFAFFAQDQRHMTVRKTDDLVDIADRFAVYRTRRNQSRLQRLKWLKQYLRHGEAKSLLRAIHALDARATLQYRVSPKFAADNRTQVGAFVN